MIYDWPKALRVRHASFLKRGMTVHGPTSLSGRQQVASLDAGYWVAALGAVAVRSETVRAFRALTALLEGGAQQIRVPVSAGSQAPWPPDSTGAAIVSAGPVLFGDGASFSDGTAWRVRIIAAQVVGATSARSTRIVIDFARAGEIVGGEYFSLGDRLHVIKAVLGEDGTQRTLAIWPPLREAVADGADADFDNPVCRMRLAGDDAADLTLDLGRFGFPDMRFVEVV